MSTSLFMVRPKIKKNVCLLHPCLPTFFFFFFFFFLVGPNFHWKITIFPLRSNVRKKKKKMHFFFPIYLPNQKIQGSGTANKQFFKDGLMNATFKIKHSKSKGMLEKESNMSVRCG